MKDFVFLKFKMVANNEMNNDGNYKNNQAFNL